MTEPRILIRSDDARARRLHQQYLGSPERAWQTVTRFGLLLALIGAGEVLLAWIPAPPLAPGARIFSAIVATAAALPLLAIGLLGALGGAVAQRDRRLVRLLAGANLGLAALLGLLLLVFLAMLPGAVVRAAPVGEGLLRTGAQTGLFLLGFGAAHLVAGLEGWRFAERAGTVGHVGAHP